MQRGRGLDRRYRDPVLTVIALGGERKVHCLRVVKRLARLKRQRHRVTRLREIRRRKQRRFTNAPSLIQMRERKRQKRQPNQHKNTHKRDVEHGCAACNRQAKQRETDRAPKDCEEPEKNHAVMLTHR